MQEFLTFIGHGFCHQIPARSFEAGGLLFAVCSRDTGIHLGLALAVLTTFVLYARARIKPGNLPPLPFILVLVALVIPMAVDGVSSYAGWRPTTNTIRFVTGLLTGLSLGSLLAPFLLGLRRDADLEQKAFTEPRLAAAQLIIPLALGLLFLAGFPTLGAVAPFFEAFCFIGEVVCVNLLLLSVSRRFAPTGSARRWLTILSLAFLLATLEISAAALFREFVLNRFVAFPPF